MSSGRVFPAWAGVNGKGYRYDGESGLEWEGADGEGRRWEDAGRREKQDVCAGLFSSTHLIRQETPTWPPLSL